MITAADIKFKYSIPSATAGGTTAQGTIGNSLGGYASTTEWVGNGTNDVYADVTPAQNSAGLTDYRCVFIHNTSATDAWLDVVLWLDQVAGGSTVSIGLDTAGIKNYASGATAQALTIVNDTTAPAGIVFSTPIQGAELSIGTLTFGTVQAIWIKRQTSLATPMAGDGFTLRTKGIVL